MMLEMLLSRNFKHLQLLGIQNNSYNLVPRWTGGSQQQFKLYSVIKSAYNDLVLPQCCSSKFGPVQKKPCNIHASINTSFSTNSILCGKKKKSFKYDPNFQRPNKKKSKPLEIENMKAIEKTESDNSLEKMSAAELELEEPFDGQVIDDALSRRNLNRTELITEDAELNLRSLVEKFPKLRDIEAKLLIDYMEFMTMYGFRPIQCAEMAILHPSLLSNYKLGIEKGVLTWRGLGYSERDILTLFHCYPQLVDLNDLHVRTRFAFLSSYFTRVETMYAIINCLQIMYDHEKIVQAKLDYLIKTVCHTTKLIVRSLVLSHTLKHIDLRHEFLIRAGLFQLDNYFQIHKKLYMVNPKMPRDKYFSPADIVCTTDKQFLHICTNNQLSLNELAAFEELYEKEKEREKLLDSDDEDNLIEELSDEEDEGKEQLVAPTFGSNNSSAFFNRKDAADFYY